MSVSSVATPPFGPNIVRAWFETAINPLLSGLESEAALLRNGNFSWRWHTGRMLAIMPVRSRLFSYGRAANFDQFLRFHEESASVCEKHDRQVKELAESSQDLFDSLLTDQDFRALVSDSVQALLEDEPSPMMTEWIAEHVVNGSGELGAHYVIAPLWNKFRDQLLAVRLAPRHNFLSEKQEEIGRNLLQTVTDLMSCLTDARQSLSLKFDIPPEPLETRD